MTAPGQVLPLRSDEDRLEFCDEYFQSVHAKTTYSSDQYREYELPRDVDKELTDRPYYWMWVENTGQQVPPSTLRLAFSDDAMQRENERLRDNALEDAKKRQLTAEEIRFLRAPTAERLTLGSFRLTKIYDSLDLRGRFACVQSPSSQQSAPVPWLVANLLVSYRCDLVEQELVSFGICMINGQIVEGFFEKIRQLPMIRVNPTDLMTRSKMGIDQAFDRIEQAATQWITRQPTEWADNAFARLIKDRTQLHAYYDSILPQLDPSERVAAERERLRKQAELMERSAPRIQIHLNQVAFVGLPEPG